MDVTLEFFGQLTDLTSVKQMQLSNVTSTDQVLQRLYIQFPKLATATFIIALNNSIIQQDTALTSNSTIALMPPYSGG